MKLPDELKTAYTITFDPAFAAAIVRDCAKACADVYGGNAHTYASENADTYRIQDQTIASCVKAILSRYGLAP